MQLPSTDWSLAYWKVPSVLPRSVKLLSSFRSWDSVKPIVWISVEIPLSLNFCSLKKAFRIADCYVVNSPPKSSPSVKNTMITLS